MMSWLQSLENPVFVKEMRVGFREKKVFYALMAWVVIVALVASVSSLGAFDSHQGIDNLPDQGIFFMEALFWVQMGLLAMLSPSLTTSSVSGERERNSFDMLLTTHLSPPELIFGKFGFAASFIFLALCSTVPLESVVFFLGGVSLKSFFFSKLILASFGFLCALYGLMMSARETRSAYATGQTYLGLIFICWFGVFGVAGLRYAPDIPGLVYAAVALWIVYLGLFLFWKSVNHLEERSRHLKIMLTIGLVFYILFIGLAVLIQETVPDVDDAVWALSGPIHYFLFGMLLNPMRPGTRVERERFSKSPLSRPAVWMVIFSIGLLAPLTICEESQAISICLYGLMAGLGTAWFARGLALTNPKRYPQILGGCWLLLNVLPAFTAVEGFSRSTVDWHPATVSPTVMLFSYIDTAPNSLPYTAAVFYGVLFLVGVVLHWQHLRKGT
jgi:hypothetical protein